MTEFSLKGTSISEKDVMIHALNNICEECDVILYGLNNCLASYGPDALTIGDS